MLLLTHVLLLLLLQLVWKALSAQEGRLVLLAPEPGQAPLSKPVLPLLRHALLDARLEAAPWAASIRGVG